MQISGAGRIATAIFSCSLLAACGGGGGGGSSPAPVQTPVGPNGGAASRAVVISDADAILTAGKLLGGDGYAGGGPPLGAMAVVRRVRSGRQTQAACQSGGSSGVGSRMVTSSTDSQNRMTQTYSDYYDANCAQVERVATLTYPPGQQLSSSGSITGTTTEYDRTGAVIGFANVQSSWDQNSVTATTADSLTVNGPVVGRSGATCVLTSASTQSCGTALFSTVAGITTGLTASLTETFTSTGQFTGNVSAQFTGTTYSGAGSSFTLVPPASGTAWGLSGGAVMDSLSGTANATLNGSLVTAGTYSVTDSTAHVSASGSYSGSGPLTITLTQSGTALATITIDVDGNGTITYADTTKQNVAGFVIFG